MPNMTDVSLTTLDGTPTSLSAYVGKVLLVVNVASKCGFAHQYQQLEELYKKYEGRGFAVLGFPSNQFLQELGSDEAIKEYCSTSWGVTFPMFEKVKLNGKNAHPLYQELTKYPDDKGKAGKVKWNFEKFVVLPSGEVRRFRTPVEPDAPEIVALIEANLPG